MTARRRKVLRMVPRAKLAQDEIKARCLADLREMIRGVESGEITALLWFADLTGGRQRWASSGSLDEAGVIGRLRVLEHTVLTDGYAGYVTPRELDDE